MTSLLGPVLVVDDNEASRYAKSRILRRAEFDVLEAANGREALAIVARHKPRLVVLDVNLPDVNGIDLCKRIKAESANASTLVLQVSATYVTHVDTVRSLEAGADASLVEPIEPTVLVATAKALLRTLQAEDTLRNALAIEQSARSIAESANRVKDEFLATLSHELRSPLSAILTWVTLLRTAMNPETRAGREADPAQLERGLAAIERNTRHQVKLIEDLLDVSRIISGKMQLDTAPIDLGVVVASALETVASSAVAKDMKITTVIDPDVRPIRADAARTQQILSNLLSNAVKFTPANGAAEVRVIQHEDSVEIRVRDTGIGIDPHFLPHVFERFQQADSSTTRPESGLGLGLAIVRHLVELHRGRVEAASEGLGKGATFTIHLPAEQHVQLTTASPQHPSDGIVAPIPLRGIRVLVVDDDAESREAIVATLRAAGAEITNVDNVRDALRHATNDAIDLVVSDIGMPREDGYALIRQLREGARTADLAALALTAYASIGDQRRVIAAGYDAFIAKPAAANELIAMVARLARRPR